MHKRFSPVAILALPVGLLVLSCATAPRYTRGNSGAKASVSKPVSRSRLSSAGSAKTQTGIASYYGPGFHGKTTANGEKYDMHGITAAHKKLPFGTNVRVTNLDNGKTVIVRINDRGPYKKGRIIDLSLGAAKKIGLVQSGTAKVRLEVLK